MREGTYLNQTIFDFFASSWVLQAERLLQVPKATTTAVRSSSGSVYEPDYLEVGSSIVYFMFVIAA